MALKGAIDAKRLKATTVATLAGVSQPAISQYINIPGRTPEVPIFMAACQLLNLDPYQLVGVSSPAAIVDHEAALVPASTPDSHLAFLRRLTNALVDITARESSRQQIAETRTHTPRRRKRNRAHR